MEANNKYKLLEHYFPEILIDITTTIQKSKIAKRFPALKLSDNEIQQLIKAKEITELKIIELWKEQNNPHFKQLCSIYFDISILLENNLKTELDIYELNKTIIFGYLAEEYNLVKNYLIKESEKIWNIKINEDWYKRVFLEITKAIINIIISKSSQDIERSIKIINNLRTEQKNFEKEYLNKINKKIRPYYAGEIISLYYFANTIDLLSQHLIQVNNYDIKDKIQYYIKIAKQFAYVSNNIILELLYQYFEDFYKKLIKNTI